MSKQDVIGGLKNALESGISLKDAMQSFYNAGYRKEDVEEAAKEVMSMNIGEIKEKVQINKNSNNKENYYSDKTSPSQQVSQYPPQSSDTLGWIILIIGSLIIIGATIVLIIFRDKITGFFG